MIRSISSRTHPQIREVSSTHRVLQPTVQSINWVSRFKSLSPARTSFIFFTSDTLMRSPGDRAFWALRLRLPAD
jgi:hypothetical protein